MTTMPAWSETAIRILRDGTTCPVCRSAALVDGQCPACAADLRGATGEQLWDASQSAATALERRQRLLNRVPMAARVIAPVAVSQPQAPSPTAPMPPSSAPRSSATLQSVLAIAGAGLFAIAAIVFTFFNPDLTDRALRSLIVAFITLVFLGGAWLLARRGLQFSAEAVGALGLVFVALDVWALAQLAPPSLSPWLPIAGLTLVSSIAMIVAASLAGIRIWLCAPLVTFALVPTMWGEAAGQEPAAVLGRIGTSFVAAALVLLLPRIGSRFAPSRAPDTAPDVSGEEPARPPKPFGTERIALLILQLLASGTAILLLPRVFVLTADLPSRAAPSLLTVALLLGLLAVHALLAARHALSRFWSFAAGGMGVSALALALYVPSVLFDAMSGWFPALMPAAFAVALVLAGPVRPLAGGRRVPQYLAGAITSTLLAAVPTSVTSAFFTLETPLSIAANLLDGELARPATALGVHAWAFPLGLLATASGFAIFALRARGHSATRPAVPLAETLASAFATLALLTTAAATPLPFLLRVLLALGAAAVIALVTLRIPALSLARRVTALIAAHLLLTFGVILSWADATWVPLLGIAALIALTAVARAMPPTTRFAHVGVGYAYALVLIATTFDLLGVRGIAVPAVTTSIGLLGAIVATFLPRVGARSWYAILTVTAVPFALGVVQVVFERSGWTALSTGMMFALALALLLSRRPGVTPVLRTAAAALLVPTLAVVIICLGAQVLAMSASPVTLPIIAVLVALVLPSTTVIADLLRRNGLSGTAAHAARLAIEASALLTGAIAVLLALVREASGLGTSVLVLLILGVGSTASALLTRRRYAWWAAGVSFTGALWCVWALAGIGLLEPYLLPPAVAAMAVAVALRLRGLNTSALYATALAVAIVPILVLTMVGPDAATSPVTLWRGVGLALTAWVLLAAAAMTRTPSPRSEDGLSALLDERGTRVRHLRKLRLRPLQVPTLIAAAVAAVGATTLAVRIGIGTGMPWMVAPATAFGLSLLASAVGAGAVFVAARGIRAALPADHALASSRWLEAPAALALPLGAWFAIERDWVVIWAMWALLLAMLTIMLVVARRTEHTHPPVWYLFGIAFVTAIVAWSPRDLRVEWFSLPLGLFLLAAGASALRRGSRPASPGTPAPTLASWPGRWSGSWALLAPGLIVTVLASIVATFTDPLTWRAIMVIAFALLAILIGAARRLAAPFVIGMLVLPVENVFAFSVQIGRGIESMPWWITLAVVGAVLLILAVTYERRAGESGSVMARIRDLS